MLTKNAVGNLLKRYSAVLKKCAWLNACVLTGAVMCGGVMGSVEMEVRSAWAKTLQQELESQVNVAKDGSTYTLQGDITIIGEQLKTDGTLSIIGGSSVGDPKFKITHSSISTNPFIEVESDDTLTIKNVIVTNNGSMSPFIFNEGTLFVSDVDFNDNILTVMGTQAAAIRIDFGDTLTVIENSTFKNNLASDSGGVIATTRNENAFLPGVVGKNGSILKITNCEFSGNKSEDSAYNCKGGAIYYVGTQLTIGDSSFKENYAQNYGGAIANECDYYRSTGETEYTTVISNIDLISNTIFEKNKANEEGGAFLNSGSIESIVQTKFNGNISNKYGGAIANNFAYFVDYNILGYVFFAGTIDLIQESYFTENQAVNGGAIYNCSGSLSTSTQTYEFCSIIKTIDAVNFIGNTASNVGGAICNVGIIETISNSNFTNNTATSAGGAIFNQGTFTYVATTDDNVISGNSANHGGFLYATSDSFSTFDVHTDKTLTIGAADLLNNTDDSIYTESGSTFTKTGAGTLLVRSNFDNNGALVVNEGIMMLEGDVAKEGREYWFDNADLTSELNKSKVILALGASLNVGDGLAVGTGATVDVQNPTNGATFASDSALVVHAAGTGAQNAYDSTKKQAALVGNGKGSVLAIADGAKLIIHGGDPNGADFRIAENFEIEGVDETGVEVPQEAWTVTHSNPLYTVDKAYWKQEAKSENANSGMRTVGTGAVSAEENVADNYYVHFGVSPEAPKILGDLAQLASIAGVASNTASIATSAMDASGARFAIPNFDPEFTRSFNVWATPLFSSVYADGFDSSRDGKGGRSGYDTKFGGMNIGADYTTDKGYRFGLGLHAGYGETESHGGYEHTDNDFSFWGVTLYGGRTWNDFSVYADVNMSMTESELVQDNPLFATAPLGAETDAYALTAEVRADYSIRTDFMEVLPHVGARFMNVNIDGYDVKQLGNTICGVESADQNIWSFPVGVELSKTFDLSAPQQEGQADQEDPQWTLTPRLDLGVIVAAGDIDADSTAYMPDRSLSQNMTMQTFDRFAYTVDLGVEMECGSSTFGLEYGTRLSEHQTVQDVSATWRYEF